MYWKHYFEWGTSLQQKIKALINARKVAGIHSGSAISLQNDAASAGVYAARVVGRNGTLYVRIGGSDAEWQPSFSNYTDYSRVRTGSRVEGLAGLAGQPRLAARRVEARTFRCPRSGSRGKSGCRTSRCAAEPARTRAGRTAELHAPRSMSSARARAPSSAGSSVSARCTRARARRGSPCLCAISPRCW
jgi:hypothetical protein